MDDLNKQYLKTNLHVLNRIRQVFSSAFRNRKSRRLIIITTLAILIPVAIITVLRPMLVKADSLLGFNEGSGTQVHDNSGSALGNITNAVWKAETECLTGNCLFFDGTGDYVSFGDEATYDFAASTNWTIELWFKTVPISSGTRTLISKYNAATSTDGGYKIYMSSDGKINFTISDDQATFPKDIATSTNRYDDNRWHFVSATKTGISNITLFIDAQNVAQDTDILTQNTLANTDSFFIGSDNGTSNGWLGYIDEVKVLVSTARNSDEVKSDFQKTSSTSGVSVLIGPDTSALNNGLVGYWKMDDQGVDTEGETITDYSGNSKPLTVYGNNGSGDNGTGMNCTVPGLFGTGCDMDGVDDYMNYANTWTQLSGASAFTVSVWIRPNFIETTADDFIVFETQSDTSVQIKFSNGVDDFELSTITSNGSSKSYTTDLTWTADTWHHLVFTYNGSEQIVYWDRNEEARNSQTGALRASAWVAIGSGTNSFDGTLDELRVYNRALSSVEVSQLNNWAPNPIVYYKMDESSYTNDCATDTIIDYSGNRVHGKSCPAGTGISSSVLGKYDKAVQFNGSSQYLTIPAFDTPYITIETWIKIPATAGWHSLINRNQYPLAIEFLGGDLYFHINASGNVAVASLTWDANRFYHMAFTYDGTKIKIYRDGIEVASYDYTGTINTSSNPWQIGTWNTASEFFDGIMDDLKIYNYARTPGQIVEDMNTGNPSPGSTVGSVVAKWSFDEGYGDTTHNSGYGGSTLDGNLGAGTSCPQSGDSACPTWTNNGKFGKALDFDTGATTDDYISIPDDASLRPENGSWSSSVWAKLTDQNQNGGLICKGAATSPYEQWCLAICNNGDCSGTGKKLSLAFFESSSTTYRKAYTVDDAVDGNWHHYVFVANKNEDAIYLYVDGVRKNTVNSAAGVWPTVNNTDEVRIGRDNGVEYLDGIIDEVKVYNYPLTDEQVKIEYNQGQTTVMGTRGNNSSYEKQSTSQEYCVPGDTASCDAPVGEWKLDENAGTSVNDASGYLNVGSFSGSPLWVSGKKGSALELNGSSDYINVSNTSGLSIDNAVTVSAWLYKHSNIPYAGIFGNDNQAYNVMLDASGTNARLELTTSGGVNTGYDASVAIPNNTWTHLTVTWDTTTNLILFYYNGILVSSVSDGGQANLNNLTTPNVGYQGLASRYFDGVIDEVQVYNYARSPAQVVWDYNRGAPTAWYKFDECQGTVAANEAPAASGLAPGMNGTIYPQTGNNVGTCGGTAGDMWADGTTGKYNASLAFDGTDDYISVTDPGTNSALDMPDDWSISTWVKFSSLSNLQMILFKGNPTDANYYLSTTNSPTNEISCGIVNGGNAYGDSTIVDGTPVNLTSGPWYHIVCSYTKATNTIKIYVNGVKNVDISNLAGTPAVNNGPLIIGSVTANTLPFDGQIDNVRIYNYVLTQNQVNLDYNNGSGMYFK